MYLIVLDDLMCNNLISDSTEIYMKRSGNSGVWIMIYCVWKKQE